MSSVVSGRKYELQPRPPHPCDHDLKFLQKAVASALGVAPQQRITQCFKRSAGFSCCCLCCCGWMVWPQCGTSSDGCGASCLRTKQCLLLIGLQIPEILKHVFGAKFISQHVGLASLGSAWTDLGWPGSVWFWTPTTFL